MPFFRLAHGPRIASVCGASVPTRTMAWAAQLKHPRGSLCWSRDIDAWEVHSAVFPRMEGIALHALVVEQVAVWTQGRWGRPVQAALHRRGNRHALLLIWKSPPGEHDHSTCSAWLEEAPTLLEKIAALVRVHPKRPARPRPGD